MSSDREEAAGSAPSPSSLSASASLRPGLGTPDRAVVTLALDQLKSGITPRSDGESLSHVHALAETFDDLPPIVVHRQSLTVVDGNHRLRAAEMLGRRTIQVVFFDGTDDEAYVEAVRCNISHGRPLSLRERETAAARILASHPEWSDRQVAVLCGLSPKTVARRRSHPTAADPQLHSRIGRDGRRRPIDPASLRSHIAERLRHDPHASLREIAKQVGASPGTVRDVRDRLQRGESPLPPGMKRRSACGNGADGQCRASAAFTQDPALISTPETVAFADWFANHSVDDGHWAALIDCVPLSRVYVLAQEARRCAESWNRLAQALEERARSRR